MPHDVDWLEEAAHVGGLLAFGAVLIVCLAGIIEPAAAEPSAPSRIDYGSPLPKSQSAAGGSFFQPHEYQPGA
jgi:hypothetical protein